MYPSPDPPAVGALYALLTSAGVRCVRKWRLLACAITRRVLTALSDGRVKEAVRASIEFSERLADDDNENGEESDERTKLIRSYDRRQLIQPIADVIRRLSETVEAEGESNRSPIYWALSAAYRPVSHDITSVDINIGWAARSAIICYEQQVYDPEWRDREVYEHADFQEAEQQLALGRDIFGDLSRLVAFASEWRTDPRSRSRGRCTSRVTSARCRFWLMPFKTPDATMTTSFRTAAMRTKFTYVAAGWLTSC